MSAGRLAIELAYVMPDQKTVYITDDGTNVMLGIYKLSLAGDMSCGTTWAAQMKQTSSEGGLHLLQVSHHLDLFAASVCSANSLQSIKEVNKHDEQVQHFEGFLRALP